MIFGGSGTEAAITGDQPSTASAPQTGDEPRGTVFLAGSRMGSTKGGLPQAVVDRVASVMRNGLAVVVGDANGADRALQQLLYKQGYGNVTIYVGGANRVRNQLDPDWPVKRVGIDSGLEGKELMTLKDEAMGEVATYGLMVWNDVYTGRFGQKCVSSGTLRNVWQLLGEGKPVALYYVPEERFFDVGTLEEFEATVLPHTDPLTQRYWTNKLMKQTMKARKQAAADAQGSLF